MSMERLTKKDKYGHYYTNKKINDRMQYGELFPHAFDGKPIDKLAEYEDLEERGLLLRLPCKIGSETYLICSRYTKCSENDQEFDEYSCQGCEYLECDSSKEYYIHKNNSVSLEWIVRNIVDFGKTVFLTKEEAEWALKEMEKK